MSTPERQILGISPLSERSVRSEATHPLQMVLWEAVIQAPTEKGYVPDRIRQETVFDRIPWDTFRDDVFAGVGDPRSKGAGKQLRGKLFEMLIRADPAFGERTALEKELLALAHNPDAFGLGKELGYYRNPDMAFLIVQKDDGVEIVGVGESKLGLLNERSFKQLSETGFARGVKMLAEVVNTLEDPAKYGLTELAKTKAALSSGGQVLTVSPEFTQLLVVPANRNTAWLSTLINRKEFSTEGRDKFYELLEDAKRVRTAKAAFSTAEVSALVHALGYNEAGTNRDYVHYSSALQP